MIQPSSINLKVDQPIEVRNSVGAVLGKLSIGNYVAEHNTSQQPGWYKFYEADDNFVKTKPVDRLANINLTIATDGRVTINA
jgi:hypothetical protein